MNTPSRIGSVSSVAGCVVCGARDARALSTLKLVSGLRVFVCGSHDLIYRRSGETATTVEELCAITRERRETDARRLDGEDELATQLRAAFTAERREASADRRR